jgi:hypothetical protein
MARLKALSGEKLAANAGGDAAVIATHLAGGKTRLIRGALQALLKAAPLSKSAVSRVVATLQDGLEAWHTDSLAAVDVIYLYLDGFLRAPTSRPSSARGQALPRRGDEPARRRRRSPHVLAVPEGAVEDVAHHEHD